MNNISPQIKSEIIEKYKNNTTINDLCKIYKMGTGTLYGIFKEANLPPKKVNKLTNEQLKEISYLYLEERLSQREIAKKYGVSHECISRNLVKLGISLGVKQTSRKTEEKVLQLLNEGKNYKQIRKECAVTTTTIHNILKKNNLFELKRVNYTENEIEEILKYHNKGLAPYQIAQKINSTRNRVAKILVKLNIKCHEDFQWCRKYEVNHNFLDNIVTQEQAYFMGFMWTDGTVSLKRKCARLALDSKDTKILQILTDLIQPDKPLTFKNKITEKNKLKRTTATLTIESEKICNDLNNLGCMPAKTYILEYPKTLPDNLHSHFIRGAIDGDGCIFLGQYEDKKGLMRYKAHKVQLVGSKKFLKRLGEIVEEKTGVIGIHSYCERHHKNIGLWTVNGRKKCLQLLNWVYEDSKIHLDRKFDKYKLFQVEPPPFQ